MIEVFVPTSFHCSGDEGFRATSRLLDAAKSTSQPQNMTSDRTTGTQLAFGFDGSIFAWMSAPEHAWRNQRLGQAMQQLHGVLNGKISEGPFFPFTLAPRIASHNSSSSTQIIPGMR